MALSGPDVGGCSKLQRRPAKVLFFLVPVVLAAVAPLACALEIDKAREQYRTGQYAECFKTATQAIEDGAFSLEWRMLSIRSQMALGKYEEAAKEAEAIRPNYRYSIRTLWLAYEAFLSAGQTDAARGVLREIYQSAGGRRVGYVTHREMVDLGRAALLLGADPRQVLDQFYNRVLTSDPNCMEAYLAAGDLAISKRDYELAAEHYRAGLERFPGEADLHVGLAKAFYNGDRRVMLESLAEAVEINPNHAEALVLLAEHQIDCEDYKSASQILDKALDVNPWHPRVWAYEAAVAELENDPNTAEKWRGKALKFWTTNPEVDYVIGRKLSQNYRFADGAKYQRQALSNDPNHLPAKLQLAEDLLRLGDEDEGWKLADEVHEKDGYNVAAYNLANLKDNMSRFATLEKDGLVVRMDKKEAQVYGDRVLRLLSQAKKELCEKYGHELTEPVTVELFANQQDFAIRTFGMPGGDGFLGVCFGNVITANSPKAEQPSNWESMLWHEFGHVVTLNMTNNRMPRWLSEGISVYEERQRSSACGQRMTPEYRATILEGGLTPVSNLSAAFMSPPTPEHLQLAYYESSLVVEFIVERFGMDSLLAILADLAKGGHINEAIARHTAPISDVEDQFGAFARERAEALAPGMDWELPEGKLAVIAREGGQSTSSRYYQRNNRQGQAESVAADAIADWLKEHPNSYWGLRAQAQMLLAAEKWEQAKAPLDKLIELYPGDASEENAYIGLAAAHRKLGETDKEAEVLGKLAAVSSEAAPVYVRLMEIAAEKEDWATVAENAQKYLAVYPMLAKTHRMLGRASEALEREGEAVEAYECLLVLDPADPVDVHYRLATLLRQRDPAAARRHILEALADAPRFRKGHQLLLEIVEQKDKHAEKMTMETIEEKQEQPGPPPDGQSETEPGESAAMSDTQEGTL